RARGHRDTVLRVHVCRPEAARVAARLLVPRVEGAIRAFARVGLVVPYPAIGDRGAHAPRAVEVDGERIPTARHRLLRQRERDRRDLVAGLDWQTVGADSNRALGVERRY